MSPAFRRTVLSISVMVAVAGAYAAGPSASTLSPAGAQAPPVIKAAGLFSFPGDWSKIPEATVTVFCPGQASWEFVTSASHPGSKEVLSGTTCQTCHAGQEKTLGEKLVKPHRLEPDPIAGKRGSVDVSVRAAFDEQYVYFRFEWQAPQPGASHELWRYDGTRWGSWGGPQPETNKANR